MAIDLTSNIISRWKLDDVSGTIVNDSTGEHNGSTTDISTVTSLNSPDGRSRSFFIDNDSSKVVTVLDSTDFSFNNASGDLPFSFVIWVNNGGVDFDGTLISKMNSAPDIEYHFAKLGSETVIILYDGDGNDIHAYYPSSSYSDGYWHCLAAIYDGRGGEHGALGIRFYVDGEEISPTTQSNSGAYDKMENTSANVVLGGKDDGGVLFDGYIADVMIFNKAITDGEIKYLYNDGFGVENFIISDSISAPSLISPNGGEIFTEGDINIEWVEPGSLSSTELIWYEIFITDDFNHIKKPELIQIATVPSGNTSYSYTIQKNLRGKKSRIGIRSVNNKGLRSNICFSANSFTIINESLPSPVLIEPVKGSTYFSYILFVFDHNGVLGRSSQRSFYQIYYKSDNQNIDWTLLKSNIMVGTDPVNIDVSSFNTSSDYIFKIEMVDGDNVSAPVFIDEINLNNINLFIIDTSPPVGSIQIANNNEYTNNTSLILRVSASDEMTAVKDVQIQQTNTITGETNNLEQSPFVPLTPLLTWDIKPEGTSTEVIDGVKLIQARFRDYGGNRLQIGDKKYFRTYKNLGNREVTSFLYGEIGSDSSLYYAFAGDEDTGASAELYKNLTFVSTLIGDATSLEIYNDVLYIAIKDDENKGILQRLTNAVNTIVNNEEEFLDVSETIVNSLYSADSVINAMVVFDDTLFLGLENGSILSFKGSGISLENEDYFNMKSVRAMRTDGIMLYIFFHNTTEMLVMNKNSSGNYVFNLVNTEN